MPVQKAVWIVRHPLQETDRRVRETLLKNGSASRGPLGHIMAQTPGTLMGHRASGQVTVVLQQHPDGTRMSCTVEMPGTGHQWVFDKLTEGIGVDNLDDKGLAQAIARMGKMSKLLSARELSTLRNVLRDDEEVRAIAQGIYVNNQGFYKANQSLIVLTTRRLFLYEKGILNDRTQEFALEDITSMTLARKWMTCALDFTVAGKTSTITGMEMELAESLAGAYRDLRHERAHQPPAARAAPPQPDVLAQLEQLGKLRDVGVLTEDEFQAKKQDLLSRL